MNKEISSNSRVRLVAICKDEGAYLAEWIFHHLYVGVDSIKLYVNRTTDNTIQILNRIIDVHSNVEYEIVDWIDLLPGEVTSKLQYICYAKEYGESKAKCLSDYILFLDVDEFWTSKDFKQSVPELVMSLDYPDCISFQWFNEEGSNKEFCNLSQKISGGRHPLVKSMVKIDADLKRVGFHFPELLSGRAVLADGENYKHSKTSRSAVHPQLDKERDIMIVHRMFRSKLEYLATIVKSNPEKYSAIKLNRRGYNRLQTTNKGVLVIDEVEYDKYRSSYEDFLLKINISFLLEQAKKFIQNRASLVIEKSKLTKLEHLPDLLNTLSGCNAERKVIIDNISDFDSVRNSTNKKQLVETALKLEKVSLEAAKVIWKRAYKISPNGPLISKKCQDYELI